MALGLFLCNFEAIADSDDQISDFIPSVLYRLIHTIKKRLIHVFWICCFVCLFVCLFVCFTSQVNSYGHGGTVSSPNHTFFQGKLEQATAHTFACNRQQSFLNDSAEGRRMTVEIIS